MRTAYSGRAAAYEKKGDAEKALADHNMLVTYYAIEVEILNSLDAPDRDKLLAEAADAYLARSKCLAALGREQPAQLDLKRADDLQASALKLAKKSTASAAVPAGQSEVVNAWKMAVTLMVDGVSYRLEAGEHKTIPVSGTSASCRIQAGPYLQTATLWAGKSYTIR